MCGIAGFYSKEAQAPEIIYEMISALRHRGPDAQGVYRNDSQTIALGHARLSVIDLSQEANQPMHSNDGRYIVIFNGEIYNFKNIQRQLKSLNPELNFLTQSDTEVILHAFKQWGMRMVDKLEGMFAIAIVDCEAELLLLFRDRIGKKPLFYFNDHKHFIFASEIKALLRHPVIKAAKQVNKQVLTSFLHLGYIPEPFTIYSNIFKFPSGSSGIVDKECSLSLHPYWQILDHVKKKSIAYSQGTAKQQFNTLLSSAVEKRMVSDVPLGSFLSGGTDSSLVTAIATRYSNEPLKTFSIGFQDSEFDERSYASNVARHLNTNHQEYMLMEKEAIDILETYLYHFDEPFADTSAIPTLLVSRLARQQVTVALTGDGGDELFLGYGSYDWANRLENPIVKAIQTPLFFLFKNFGSSKFKRISHLFQKVNPSEVRSHIFSQEQYLFSKQEIERDLFATPTSMLPLGYDERCFEDLNPAEKQALFDLQFYLKDDLLVKVDRSSMFYGLECRCPLLDSQVVEFALGLDYNFKKRGAVSKWIMKELLLDYLPENLVKRPKWGFGIPLSKWLRNELRYLIEDYLSEASIHEAGLVKYSYVEKLKKKFFSGENYLYNRLWVLVVMHKWLKDNG